MIFKITSETVKLMNIKLYINLVNLSNIKYYLFITITLDSYSSTAIDINSLDHIFPEIIFIYQINKYVQ